MTTTPTPPHIDHTAVFIRDGHEHYHQQCIPVYCTSLHAHDVPLDMDKRSVIAQTQAAGTVCASCKQPPYLFADRKVFVLEEWPNEMIGTPEQARVYVEAVQDQLYASADNRGILYRLIYAWIENPQDGQSGFIKAIGQEEPRPQEEEPPQIPQAANKKFTPGPWAVDKTQGYGMDRSFIHSEHPSRAESPLVGWAFRHSDARLIAEAPTMFVLLNRYRVDHTAMKNGELCTCNFCLDVLALIKRVGGEG